ncbi:hypothetical protein NDU88_006111 [Pleurodeles waltl]|uniref:Uncharacterized protein n=1 Tax=Pleurodeles waltl TaxID=8319 RepID=A0AAV7NPB4_PLEWA|nr:hypothetical protein NDU88_006111 [Pleurodeles waltl]
MCWGRRCGLERSAGDAGREGPPALHGGHRGGIFLSLRCAPGAQCSVLGWQRPTTQGQGQNREADPSLQWLLQVDCLCESNRAGIAGPRSVDKHDEHAAGWCLADEQGRCADHAATGGGLTQQDILQAITASQEALETKIDTLGAEFGLLKDDHCRLAERVTVVKREFLEVLTSISDARLRLTSMEDKVRILERRAEDAENHSMRNNIHVVGMPKNLEGRNMIAFLESWIKEDLALTDLSPYFVLESSHRVPLCLPCPGSPP